MRKVKFKQWDCILEVSEYSNGGIALLLNDADDGEPIATASVWIEGIPEGCVAIKDYSENEGMTDALINAKIIKPQIIDFHRSGFVTIMIYEFIPEK